MPINNQAVLFFMVKSIKTVGIIGAGMMGKGIANVCSNANLRVVISDITLENAQAAKQYCSNPAKIIATENYHDLNSCDLVIEAVFEDVELKQQIYSAIEPLVSKNCIIATNTSTLPISLLAEACQIQERFIGLHFFSPVEKMPLLEIIKGNNTTNNTVKHSLQFAKQINKTPITVKDSRGFFTSRVFFTYLDAAMQLLLQGVDPERIEVLCKLAGYPTGPLAVCDEVSLRLTLEIHQTNLVLDQRLNDHYADPNAAIYTVCKTLVEKYQRAGRAYGAGFYEYPKDKKKYLWPGLKNMYYKPEFIISDQEIIERIKFREATEAAKCVEEGIISVDDANTGSILGIGFPPQTGGAISYYYASKNINSPQ